MGIASQDEKVRIGSSVLARPDQAAKEIAETLGGPGTGFVFFFSSPKYDLEALAGGLRESFGDTPVVGCTTAGEIGPEGYTQGGIVAVRLPSSDFHVTSGVVEGLDSLSTEDYLHLSNGLRAEMAQLAGKFEPKHCFASLLIDGLSLREEFVASALAQSLESVPLFGGSAGDDLRFESTLVYSDGRFRSNAAVVTLVQTERPFTVFKSQHFVRTEQRLVVTAADVGRRTVYELDGESAAPVYADAVGVRVEDLTPEIFATHPVLVRVGGAYYVRAIQRANDDGSLVFYCAIDEGIVLALGQGVDAIESAQQLFGELRSELGDLDLVLGCDCILRRLEFERKALTSQFADIFRANHLVGFSTYGEQIHGMHVNQTLTGVAVGGGAR